IGLMAEARVLAEIGNQRKPLQCDGQDAARVERVVEPMEFHQHILEPDRISLPARLPPVAPCVRQTGAIFVTLNGSQETKTQAAVLEPLQQRAALSAPWQR